MSSPTERPKGRQFLMVDDNEQDIHIAELCFERSDLPYEFLGLTSGAALLEFLDDVRAGTRDMPIMIMLDINMPVMNGFEALEKVRAQPKFRVIPIIMMLTHSDAQRDIDRSEELGADGFYTKPQRVADFVAFFNSLADRCESPSDQV